LSRSARLAVFLALGCAGNSVRAGAAGGADANAAGADAGRWGGLCWGAAAHVDAGCSRCFRCGGGEFRDATAARGHVDSYCDADPAQPYAATANANTFGDAVEPDTLRELHSGFAADG